mgnify:CR=1 FL=1
MCIESGYIISTFLYLLEVFYIANSKNNLLINEQIKIPQVLVIGPNGEQTGVKSIKDALTLANYAGLDLVLIGPNGNPPVCKLMDYNKYKYEKNKKEKDALKKQKANMQDIKEFRLSPVIDIGDFDTKVNQVTKYLQKGDKIRVTIRFKGRQLAHTEIGEDVLNRFATKLSDICEVEQKPKLDGKNMIMLLTPKK